MLNKRPFIFCLFFPCKSKEWPQKRQAALMYLGPTERPPEEPEEKPSRPPLYVRLYRRLRLYWSSPPKGEVCVFWHKLTGKFYSFNRLGGGGGSVCFTFLLSHFYIIIIIYLLCIKTMTLSRYLQWYLPEMEQSSPASACGLMNKSAFCKEPRAFPGLTVTCHCYGSHHR